jgi:hypothetical protein
MMMCLRANGVSEKETTPELVNEVMGALPMHGASWEQALACAQHYGMRATLVVPSTIRQIKDWTDRGIPVMIAWNPEGREWSHASVVFDVDDDLNVYVADSNIPDPDETVRVVTKDEFYHAWAEKYPHYLVRRPAMAVEREITVEGRQVVAKKLAPIKIPRLPPTNEAGKALSQRSQGGTHHNRDYDAAKGRNRKDKHKKQWDDREATANQSLSLRPDYGTGDSLGNRLDQAREALVAKVASRYLKGQEK